MQTAPTVLNTKRERNYGIDLLRIVSMIMIVVLHVLGQGGVLRNTVPLSYRYEVAWFLEIASYCAVNCYAIISGYVAVKSKFKYSNIVYLWLQVVFYTVSIAAIMAVISPNIGKAEVIDALFPVSNRLYWYFTAYFCIYFFTPVFNKAIEYLSEKQLKAIGVSIFMLFCIIPILADKDTFHLNNGYTPIWLMMLYILGGIINKCNLFGKMKSWIAMLIYLLMVVITWAERLICDYLNANVALEEPAEAVLTNYTSPTIFFAAVFLLVGFTKLKIGKIATKIIAFCAPASFGVYIIHVNPYIWQYFLKNRYTFIAKFGTIKLAIAVVMAVVVIFTVCLFIDILREQLFKLLRIKKLLQKAESKIFKNIW